MNVLDLVKNHEQEIIEIRRYLHENPELSGEEENTVKFIEDKLTSYGVKFTTVKKGGIICEFGDETKGPTVLLRADIDALPMQENPENLKGPRVCVSKFDGKCHACGHDGHTAMMLIAAKVLQPMEKDLAGRILIVFERGEEMGKGFQYLMRYLSEKAYKIDTTYATHLLSSFNSGQISIEPGGVMAASVGFGIIIHGRGGHGSRPDLSVSPIDCFNAFYNGLNALRMKYTSPFETLTFSMGYVQSGHQGNIIPDDLSFGGTVRFFDNATGWAFHREFLNMLENTCNAYHCTYEIERLSDPSIAVINSADASKWAKKVFAEALGESFVGKVDPWMASESYSLYLHQWPGVFAFLGIKNPEVGSGAEHHNEKFDIDEAALAKGSAATLVYALEYLKQRPTFAPTGFKGTPWDLLVETKWDKSIVDD